MPLSRRGWFDSVGDRRSSTKGWLRIAAGLLRLLICRFFLDRIEHRRLSGSTQGLRGLFRAPTHGLRRVEAVATRCEINRNECRIKTAAGRQTINTTYAWQNVTHKQKMLPIFAKVQRIFIQFPLTPLVTVSILHSDIVQCDDVVMAVASLSAAVRSRERAQPYLYPSIQHLLRVSYIACP